MPAARMLITIVAAIFSLPLSAMAQAQAAPPSGGQGLPLGTIRVHAPGSKIATESVDLPVKSAWLIFDTVDYFSKAHGSPTKAHETMTTMYLVLSNRDGGCEVNDIFNASDFIRHNKPRLEPRIPAAAGETDWTVVISFQIVDPTRKTRPIVQEFASAHPAKAINFPFAGTLLYDSSGKHGKAETPGGTPFAVINGELWLSSPTLKPKPAVLTVSHGANGWDTAALKIDSKEIAISGKIPIQMCAPNYIEIR